ncbi:MAG: peroxidase-related enzyme [Acidimicrobiia bacterium]
MFIRPVPADEAPNAVADMYSAERSRWGFLPEFTEVFSHHPDAYAAWIQLIGAVRRQMDSRRCELVTLAAARALRSSYCTTAHGKILSDRWYEPDTVIALVSDHRTAGLDAVDIALMDFATRVAVDPTSITEREVDHLRELGLSERDILDVVLAVAARCFFATVIESMGAQPDRELLDPLPPNLRDALLVGRQPE